MTAFLIPAGDPEQLASSGRRFGEQADQLGRAADEVARQLTGLPQIFLGPASLIVQHVLAAAGQPLRTGADALADAAGATCRYATVLRDSQIRARALQQRWEGSVLVADAAYVRWTARRVADAPVGPDPLDELAATRRMLEAVYADVQADVEAAARALVHVLESAAVAGWGPTLERYAGLSASEIALKTASDGLALYTLLSMPGAIPSALNRLRDLRDCSQDLRRGGPDTRVKELARNAAFGRPGQGSIMRHLPEVAHAPAARAGRVLGVVALPLGIVMDAKVLISPDQSHHGAYRVADRVAAGADGLASAGALALAMVSPATVAAGGAVVAVGAPVVAAVLLGTAAYFAGSYAYDHRRTIAHTASKAWTSSGAFVEDAADATSHAVQDAADWTADAAQDASEAIADAGQHVLHTVTHPARVLSAVGGLW